jgi:hypothetical protein
MSIEQEARDRHAKDAALERLWTHTVGIANRALGIDGIDPTSGLPGREDEIPGTGIAGTFKGRHVVLTARHVLDEAQPSDLSFFARPSGAFARPSEVSMQDGYSAIPIVGNSSAIIHRCEWEDIAVIIIESDALGPYLEFADLASSVDPEEGEFVLGMGFPVSNAFVFQRRVGSNLQKAVLLAPIAFQGEVLPSTTGRFLKGFCADRHFLIPYDLAAQGKHPKGISGAGVWLQSKEKQVVWTPSFIFAGICTSCYREGTIEQIVKASAVRAFLEEVSVGC